MPEAAQDLKSRDSHRAVESVTKWCGDFPPDSRVLIRNLVARSPEPDRVAIFIERFCQAQPEAWRRQAVSPAAIQNLITVFSYSQFLSEETLQHPEWLDDLIESGDLYRHISREEYEERLERLLGPEAARPPSPLVLAQFRRRQLLRIVLRDVQGYCTVSETTQELSHVADAVLDVTYWRLRAHLIARYGVPRCSGAQGEHEGCGFSVISLGKLGGQELNYSSDIDLLFLYHGQGQTDGAKPVSNKEFFIKLANQYTELLSVYTAEGLCYRVDLRLRPEGRLGEVCVSLDAAKCYYETRARDWELQMLIKARVSAGDRELGRELLHFAEPLIYSSTLDFTAVESVSAARHRIKEELLAKRGGAGLNVKLARGGIRDIEFLVQCLQRLHGGRDPWVRHGGTLLALFRLRDKELLSDTEYSRLAWAYTFLRNLEHRLQFAEDLQIHTIPTDQFAQEPLARKMPPPQGGEPPSAQALLMNLNRALEEVSEIYERVIHAQQPSYYTSSPAPGQGIAAAEIELFEYSEPAASNLVRFLDQKAPRLAAKLSRQQLRRGLRHFELFLERVLQNSQWLSWLDSDETLAGHVLDLFEHSPYFAEQLIRRPEFVEELRLLRNRPEFEPNYADIVGQIDNIVELRRYFAREMLRLQAKSICLRNPIFATLERTSDLADAAIAATYRMAVEQLVNTHPPADLSYYPHAQMMVVALGRLGMREFDLASDADLSFVLPDSDRNEHLFWTRVAERMIQLITAYTSDGVMFSVDTRLRPNGSAGALVQLEGSWKEYISKRAEAWEGITYMKSRGVAGTLEHATEFLNELQELDWRRYGQSGRSRKQLAEMRMRVEREQGAINPLKAGRGGYYDIDFALMYLRLKGGGIFFKVLNTPARIDVVEKMGHLDRADAVFLRDAAILYRAVDHGLRVFSGQAEGDLPQSPGQLRAISELVERWTPDHLHDQPLDKELSQIRERTREFFERTFL